MSNAARQAATGASEIPTRRVDLLVSKLIVDRRPDGTIYLRSEGELAAYPDKLTEKLDYWAKAAPDRVFMAARDEKGAWRKITYAEMRTNVRRIAAALLTRKLTAEAPIAILSGNDLEHAMLGLAANYIGIPYVPVSPAYSLVSEDFGKLRHIFKLLTPGLVFAADGKMFGRALSEIVPADVEVIVTRNAPGGRAATSFSELLAGEDTPAVDQAHAKVSPDTIAKILFTSGSTGQPKGVINTQRMWCSNQEMIRTSLAYFKNEPPVILDWAPWHHTAGGNSDVGIVLYNGGTFYIDEGKPAPGAIEATVRNLREIAPTWYFNVPKGFEALLPYLRNDAQLRENFFSKLKVLWFAGAAISQPVFDEMKELAAKTIGERIMFLTGLGSTETAPYAFGRMFEAADPTNMGLPAVGTVAKLVPAEGKLEARLYGTHITPGYWRQPELTAKAFDEEGFYKLGDALKFADPNDPQKGLLFDGRIAEDFKLSTGTWVSVGPLRARIMNRFAPYVRDVVLAGLNENEVTALAIPDVAAIRALHPELDAKLSDAELLASEPVRAKVQELLNQFIDESTGSSNRIARMILLDEPPSLDAGEMTDKGSINQRAVLARRANLVKELYANPPSSRVIVAEGK
jgi:feruloyl-CoA synthase